MDAMFRRSVADRPRRVVVLGGTGFVGRRLSATLESLGHQVLRVARGTAPGAAAHPVRLLDLARAEVGEIAEVLREARVDAIVNAAGGMWGLTDEEMFAANVALVEKVIAAAGVLPGPPRLVQLGSVHEYGLTAVGASSTESDVPQPVNAYAGLKLRCTEAVVEASERGVVDGVSLRIGNVTGAGQPAVSLLGVVARELWTAREEDRPAVVRMRSLGALRDFIHLSDAVSAIVTAVAVPDLPSRVFNIGTSRATSAREMVRMLIDVSGVPTDLVESEPDVAEGTWQQMSIDRARDLLGWSPRESLRDGVRELWASHAPAASVAHGT
ncbi:NAD-dependent epimerase/dehydratase family protein [Micromonospora chalcea]